MRAALMRDAVGLGVMVGILAAVNMWSGLLLF